MAAACAGLAMSPISCPASISMRTRTLLLLLLAIPAIAASQTPTEDPTRSLASRAQLQSELTALEQTAQHARSEDERDRARSQSATIRRRLTEGDFRVGDRIALTVLGDTALTDTLVVQPGPRISLSGLTELSLQGVLRAELRDHIAKTLKKYVKDPEVHAVSLLRVGIAGDVARPGYYAVPFESLLSDVIMVAGGGTGTTDLHSITIRRGDETSWDEKGVQQAIAGGYTLDQMDLRVGDEITVGSKRERNWGLILGIAGTLLGVATLLTTMSNR